MRTLDRIGRRNMLCHIQSLLTGPLGPGGKSLIGETYMGQCRKLYGERSSETLQTKSVRRQTMPSVCLQPTMCQEKGKVFLAYHVRKHSLVSPVPLGLVLKAGMPKPANPSFKGDGHAGSPVSLSE